MSESIRVVVFEGAKVTEIGWKSVSVRRQLGTCSGTFTVEAIGPSQGLLRNGQKVGIQAGSRVVLIGYVETSELGLEADSRTFKYSGRETTCDLVDCTAPVDALNAVKSTASLSLSAIANTLAMQHGIEVRFLAPAPENFVAFAIRPDESCWTAIERAARMRRVMVQGDGQGRLEFVRLGTTRSAAALVAGVNVLRADFSSTVDERFQLYRIVGSAAGDGTRGWPKEKSLALAEARDEAISRPRRLVIVAEDSVDGKTAEERAQWEALTRAARATSLRAVVPGWRTDFVPAALRSSVNPSAPFWVPNAIVPVELEALGISDELLVDTVEHSCDASGASKTSLVLLRKDAYQQLTEKGEVFEQSVDALEADE